MAFLDKIKDLFTDEEEIIETEEIEIEEKEEHKLPTFMRNKLEEEQLNEEVLRKKEAEFNTVNNSVELNRSRGGNNFSFPVDLEEEDMLPNSLYSNQNVLKREKEKPVSELYVKKEEPKPKRFKPTPVISPIYGVLDKNYTKDEVKVQNEDSYEIQRPSRKVDFETVRNKAFGNLTDDIKNVMCENCELYKEVVITKNVNKNSNLNLLQDIVDDSKDDISLGDAEDNYFDFGVSYETPKREKKYDEEEAIVDSEIKIINHNDEESSAEKIEVKEVKKTRKNKKELLFEETSNDMFGTTSNDIEDILNNNNTDDMDETNDIFNLIDSMYDEEDL